MQWYLVTQVGGVAPFLVDVRSQRSQQRGFACGMEVAENAPPKAAKRCVSFLKT